MLLGKQALAVRAQRREGLSVELRARCAGDGRAEQRRAELLARAVIRRDEARRLLLEVHQLAVFHDLARQREAVLPGHVLQELAEAFLHTIHGIVAVLADRLEALHRGHGRELLAPVVAGGDVEQLRQHAGLLEGLAALLQEHLDRFLALAENAVLKAGAFGKGNVSHCSCLLSWYQKRTRHISPAAVPSI